MPPSGFCVAGGSGSERFLGVNAQTCRFDDSGEAQTKAALVRRYWTTLTATFTDRRNALKGMLPGGMADLRQTDGKSVSMNSLPYWVQKTKTVIEGGFGVPSVSVYASLKASEQLFCHAVSRDDTALGTPYPRKAVGPTPTMHPNSLLPAGAI